MTWEKAWKEGRTGWDAGESPPALRKLVEQATLPEGPTLVPGCGAGYDAFTLCDESRTVFGLDLAETAALRFRALRSELGLSEDHAKVLVDDFFTFEPPSAFNLIWDYTFLCALPPSKRRQWAERMHTLLAPGGELVMLLFPVVDVRPDGDGPPFAVQPQEVRELLGAHLQELSMEKVEESHEGREGMEWLARFRKRA